MRAPVEHFSSCFETLRRSGPEDAYMQSGRAQLARQVTQFVEAGAPIELLLPGFAFKNPNRAKTLGPLPDLGETLALRKLAAFGAAVSEGYAPGCRVIVFSDARVWADLLGVGLADAQAYASALRAIEGLAPHVVFANLDAHLEHLPGEGEVAERLRTLSGAQPRARLEAELGLDGGPVRDDDRRRVYERFVALCDEDGSFDPRLDAAARRARCEASALSMMLRHAAFGRVLAAAYPGAIRLSVHAGRNAGGKYAVRLLPGADDAPLPYHGCMVLDPEGGHPRAMHVAAARALPGGVTLVRNAKGHPWCLQQRPSSSRDGVRSG